MSGVKEKGGYFEHKLWSDGDAFLLKYVK